MGSTRGPWCSPAGQHCCCEQNKPATPVQPRRKLGLFWVGPLALLLLSCLPQQLHAETSRLEVAAEVRPGKPVTQGKEFVTGQSPALSTILQQDKVGQDHFRFARQLREPDRLVEAPNRNPAAVNTPASPQGDPSWISNQQRRFLIQVDNATTGNKSAPLASALYWWPRSDYSFLEGSDLCAAYGGSLAVLADAGSDEAAALLANLQSTVDYWIGLVNSAGLPGRNGSWVWIDQTGYDSANTLWADGQPTSGEWCTFLRFESTNQRWRFYAGECSIPRGVLCSLPSNGKGSDSHPFGCLWSSSLELQHAYSRNQLQTPDASQQPQLCAAQCRGDYKCQAFSLSGNTCSLYQRNTQGPPLPVPNATVTVSCYKYGLDFVDMGRQVAVANLPGAYSPAEYKCVTDYRINMQVNDTRPAVCSASVCADLCTNALLDGWSAPCTAFVHSASRCRCQLGFNALYGTDLSTGPFSGAEYTTCVRSDADWLRLGALADPSLVSVTLGQRTFTLHPEPLAYDAAATVCRTQPPEGSTLASLSNLLEALSVARRLLLDQPPRLLMPSLNASPLLYGAWVGLSKNGTNLSGLVDNSVGATTLNMLWDNGTPVNRTLLQLLWAISPDGVRMYTPNNTLDRTCIYFTNDTGLMRPGLAAATSCSFALPFICEADASSTSSQPTGTPPAPRGSVAVVSQLFPATTPNQQSVAVPDTLPTIFTVPGTGVMMWVQPQSDPLMTQYEAQDMCGMWNGSLATLYNSTAEQTAVLAGSVRAPYWINLFVNNGSRSTPQEWIWGPPNTLQNSTYYLDNYQNWCDNTEPDPYGAETCAKLTYDPVNCLGTDLNGWGWAADNCSADASYMCMADPRGMPGRFFCAESYDFSGTVVGSTLFNGTSITKGTELCSDLCSATPACHTFTIAPSSTGVLCQLKSRDASSFAYDVIRSNVSLSCFKHGILWDVLGGQVAVQLGVAADTSTRFRCIQNQEVSRTDLQSMTIASCNISDCSAQCFATRMCSVFVFDSTTCSCNLGREVLLGLDGVNTFRKNVTTCMFDDDSSFLGLGLFRSAAYITPTDTDSTLTNKPVGFLYNGGGGIATIVDPDTGDLNNINFIPPDLLISPPPATNPFNPAAPEPVPPVLSPSPDTPPSLSPPGDPDEFTPSPPPPPTQTTAAESGGGSSKFGLAQMVGITAGFCGAALLLLGVMCMYIIRRRRRAAAKADLNAAKPAPADALIASLRELGISPDLERVLMNYLEGMTLPSSHRDTGASIASSGSPAENSVTPTAGVALTPALAAELETLLKREIEKGEGERVLSPASANLISLLLYTAQYSPAPGSTPDNDIAQVSNQVRLAGLQHFAAGLPKQPGSSNYAPSHGSQPTPSQPATAPGIVYGEASSQNQNGIQQHGSAGTVLATSAQGADRSSIMSTDTQPPVIAALSVHPSPIMLTRPGHLDQRGTAGFEMGSAMTSKSGISSTYITLTRLLGAGSFGTVYEGVWRRRTVAVKIIPHSPSAALRVKNEVELSMQFDHPNVVRSYFYETFDTRAMDHLAQMDAAAVQKDSQETWIVLEYCSEGSLASRLYAHIHQSTASEVYVPKPLHERDPCIASLEGILSIAHGVAMGMAYMHSLSICHGDLKCENVLLGGTETAPLVASQHSSSKQTETGSKQADPVGKHLSDIRKVVAKVGDFGLSRAIGDVSSHLSTATVGTVTHMPPELLLSGQLRPSCDVYSFGIMLWQLYTASVPYAGMRYAEIVYKVAVCNMRPTFPSETPRSYKELAEMCWQSDAVARPSFEQVVDRLAQLLKDVKSLEEERTSQLRPTTSTALSDGAGSSRGSQQEHLPVQAILTPASFFPSNPAMQQEQLPFQAAMPGISYVDPSLGQHMAGEFTPQASYQMYHQPEIVHLNHSVSGATPSPPYWAPVPAAVPEGHIYAVQQSIPPSDNMGYTQQSYQVGVPNPSMYPYPGPEQQYIQSHEQSYYMQGGAVGSDNQQGDPLQAQYYQPPGHPPHMLNGFVQHHTLHASHPATRSSSPGPLDYGALPEGTAMGVPVPHVPLSRGTSVPLTMPSTAQLPERDLEENSTGLVHHSSICSTPTVALGTPAVMLMMNNGLMATVPSSRRVSSLRLQSSRSAGPGSLTHTPRAEVSSPQHATSSPNWRGVAGDISQVLGSAEQTISPSASAALPGNKPLSSRMNSSRQQQQPQDISHGSRVPTTLPRPTTQPTKPTPTHVQLLAGNNWVGPSPFGSPRGEAYAYPPVEHQVYSGYITPRTDVGYTNSPRAYNGYGSPRLVTSNHGSPQVNSPRNSPYISRDQNMYPAQDMQEEEELDNKKMNLLLGSPAGQSHTSMQNVLQPGIRQQTSQSIPSVLSRGQTLYSQGSITHQPQQLQQQHHQQQQPKQQQTASTYMPLPSKPSYQNPPSQPPSGTGPQLSTRPSLRSSRLQVLPQGVEAHIALRAFSNSHAVLGIHALSTMGIDKGSAMGPRLSASPGSNGHLSGIATPPAALPSQAAVTSAGPSGPSSSAAVSASQAPPSMDASQ